MNNFFKVVGFELNNYFKSKAYILTTVLITAFLIVGICLPSMVDLSGIIPQLATEEKAEEDENIIYYKIILTVKHLHNRCNTFWTVITKFCTYSISIKAAILVLICSISACE